MSPGSNLLQTALGEARFPDCQSQAFSRQLYIEAISYLLQGLPSDLTSQEKHRLEETLPISIKCSIFPERADAESQAPSLLHRSVASLTVFLCLILRLALPYIKYFLTGARDYERTHHVTEKLLALSVNTMDAFSRKSVQVVGPMLDNKMVVGTIAYCIEGTYGGLNEGLREGK